MGSQGTSAWSARGVCLDVQNIPETMQAIGSGAVAFCRCRVGRVEVVALDLRARRPRRVGAVGVGLVVCERGMQLSRVRKPATRPLRAEAEEPASEESVEG